MTLLRLPSILQHSDQPITKVNDLDIALEKLTPKRLIRNCIYLICHKRPKTHRMTQSRLQIVPVFNLSANSLYLSFNKQKMKNEYPRDIFSMQGNRKTSSTPIVPLEAPDG